MFGLGAKRCLADDDCAADRALSSVVRRLDADVVDKGPERVAVLQQTQAGALRLGAGRAAAVFEQGDDAALHGEPCTAGTCFGRACRHARGATTRTFGPSAVSA